MHIKQRERARVSEREGEMERCGGKTIQGNEYKAGRDGLREEEGWWEEWRGGGCDRERGAEVEERWVGGSRAIRLVR